MHVLRIHDNEKLVKIASAVQNVCNATLSLLFTASLFLWGCFVNRRAAWRTDGGTAAFGVGALTLALISTALTFLYIPSRDQYPLMRGLMWAVILWQSFLGWWWWVGAGMGVGEVQDLLRREEKRQEKRRAKLARRKVRKERAQTIWKGMTGALGYNAHPPAHEDSSDSARSASEADPARDETVRRVASNQTDVSSRSGTGTTNSGRVGRFLHQYTAGRVVYGWYLGLRHAHLAATRAQVAERVERMNQAYGSEVEVNRSGTDGGRPAVFGWGLGSFWIRKQQRRRREEEEEAHVAYKMEVLRGRDAGSDDGSETGTICETRVSSSGEYERGDGSGDIRTRRPARRVVSDAYPPAQTVEEEIHRPTSVWWWGPLHRWRLQDSTDYRS